MSKAKKPVKQTKKGFVMPEPIPCGEILTDIQKKKWILGPSIGKGGFGEIYSACEYGHSVKPEKYPYVIKIEPHDNGPLFVEMHFYMRNAKQDDVDAFCKSRKLSCLGMPIYIGSGSHTLRNGNKYRFLVMQRFVSDLQNYYRDAGNRFPDFTVIRLALQMIDIMEYIHSRTYVHADIKAANILLNSALSQAYLVDFGLASHYNTKAFKPDPKKMHNGTIEYTSRDAHLGVPTRRGDFEILVYNLVHWLGGVLPWDSNLSNPTTVHNQKNEAGDDPPKFFKKCFTKRTAPKFLTEFAKLIFEMDNDAEPAYSKFRSIFENALKMTGKPNKGKFDFFDNTNSNDKSPSPKSRSKKMSAELDIVIEEPKRKRIKGPAIEKKEVMKENNRNIEKNVKSPRTPKIASRLDILKKKNNILEYSICEDEHVEITVKKTNIKTGTVKTVIQTQRCESEGITESVRQSPRLASREKNLESPSLFDTSEDDIQNSETECISPLKLITKSRSRNLPDKVTPEKSKWRNCATIKASKAGKYLKKAKFMD